MSSIVNLCRFEVNLTLFRNSNSKKGKRGESVAAKTPESETPQDALTMWFP